MLDKDTAAALALAVRSDHPCQDRACGIRAALDAGAPHAAACILYGATDAIPATLATLERFRLSADLFKAADWDVWKEYHDSEGRQCGACRAWNYPQGGSWGEGETCGNCLVELRPSADTLDRFTLAYLACALWSSSDDDGNPMDANGRSWREMATETLWQAVADCKDFQAANADDLALFYGEYGHDLEQAGHDFWLTRNGHGAGVRRTLYSGPVNAPAPCDSSSVQAALENARGVLNAADAFGTGCVKPGAALDALRKLVAVLEPA
jgi:hypothetical protein